MSVASVCGVAHVECVPTATAAVAVVEATAEPSTRAAEATTVAAGRVEAASAVEAAGVNSNPGKLF